MFSWLKQFGQKEEQRSNTHPNDKVEDGFLVVGQTRSEKSTVITSEFQFDQDTPPDYMEVHVYNNYFPECRSSRYQDFF